MLPHGWVLARRRCWEDIPDGRIDLAAFSALKTYDPPLSALNGLEIESVTRRGKFLDISAQGLHLVFHLARAGWLRCSAA